MKRLVLYTLCLFAGTTLQALPVGNPGEASLYKKGLFCESNQECDPCFKWYKAWSLRLGFYGDYIYDRKMQTDDRDRQINNKSVHRTEIYTNAAYLALNVCDRVDVFASLGGTKMRQHFNNEITFGFGCAELEYENAFSWSVGGRATLWECNCLLIGVEGQYFRTNPEMRKYCEFDAIFVPSSTKKNLYSDWQVGLGASYKIATSCVAMVPYAAITWSGSQIAGGKYIDFLDSNLNPGVLLIPAMDNRDLWGFAVGTTFNLCEEVGVTVEGRYGSEVGLYVNGQVRF